MPRLQPFLRRHHRRPFSSSSAAVAAGSFTWVRDRGLDHAVEREKNLIPLVNTKNLLAGEPSKSLPLSAISDRRASLSIPHRPVDFLRRYPSVFRESLPAAAVHPHFSLTDPALDLHSDETLMFSGDSHRSYAAQRLLKLLMLCRAARLPLALLRRLRWDLGLPEDFEASLVPLFPDYFRLSGSGDSRHLELVCWIADHGVSAMEKRGSPGGAFPVQYSRGFEMDKKFERWFERWQKLPYFSPYEDNAGRFSPGSEESDRWVVAVLHELLHILVPKKTERDNVMCVGECLGLRSRFKRALLRHPGIFYLSSKNYTYTLVLKEGYRRGVLVESHPLMTMRSKYIRLMNSSNEESDKPASGQVSARKEEEEEKRSEPKGESSEGDETEAELVDSSDEEKGENERGVRNDRGRTGKMGSGVRGRVGNRERGGRGKEGPRKSGERVAPAGRYLGTEKKDSSFRGRSRKTKGSSAVPPNRALAS